MDTEAMSDAPAANSATEEIPLSDLQLTIETLLLKFRGRIKHCGRSAYRHMRRAWQLRAVAPELAAFCMITAEEEAATALIFSLQRKRYPGSEMLDLRKHDHKRALYPFLVAVAELFQIFEQDDVQLLLDVKSEKPRVWLRIDVNKAAGLIDRQPLFGEPVPPLDFVISDKDGPIDFAEKFTRFANGKGFSDVVKYVQVQANERNRLLYAADNGIAHVTFPPNYFSLRATRVALLFITTLLIEQSQKHQAFVLQCLDALLLVLRKVDKSSFTPPPQPDGRFVSIERMPGTAPRLRLGIRGTAAVSYRWNW